MKQYRKSRFLPRKGWEAGIFGFRGQDRSRLPAFGGWTSPRTCNSAPSRPGESGLRRLAFEDIWRAGCQTREMTDISPEARTVAHVQWNWPWRGDADRGQRHRGFVGLGTKTLAALCLVGIGVAGAACGTQSTALRHAESSFTFSGGTKGPVVYVTQCDLAHSVITATGSVVSSTSISHAGLVFTSWAGSKVVARSTTALKPLSSGQGVPWRITTQTASGTSSQRCEASVVVGPPPYTNPS